MHADDIHKYRVVCIGLPGGEILNRYTDAVAAAICNGVGAAWTDRVAPRASAILSRALPWAVAPSIIHDLRYHEGVGGEAGRQLVDCQFLGGCDLMIDWQGGCAIARWWRHRKAMGLYRVLRKYGKFAWEGK